MDRGSWMQVPDVRIVALLTKAGSDSSTLFLNDGPLVSDRLGRSDVADELFDCSRVSMGLLMAAVIEAYENSWRRPLDRRDECRIKSVVDRS
jgi:hypothetical protein